MQTACLCDTSPVLLLDEAVGAEGLLVGLALERVTGRHLVGSHSEARGAFKCKCYLARGRGVLCPELG